MAKFSVDFVFSFLFEFSLVMSARDDAKPEFLLSSSSVSFKAYRCVN